MKKLALRLDDLAVDSFETAEEKGEEGTVLAHATTGAAVVCGCTADRTCNGCGGGASFTCGESGDNTYDVGCQSGEYCTN